MTKKNGFGRLVIARVLAGTAIGAGMCVALAAPAHAQDAAVSLDIAAGPLAGALNQFADATGYQLLYPSDLVQGKASPGARGAMSVTDGLARVLAGTGLSFRVLSGKTIQIEVPVSADGERVTGAVRVEGAQGSPYFGGAGRAAGVNGINGSRDITATEGTGSFTSGALTIGSKVPQALKDVPQSISVLTSERLAQQNVTDFTTAMRQLPGITLVQGGSSLETTFYSRGFAITSIQLDGGMPLATEFAGGGSFGFYPQIDMAVYDHVELLRGAAGQFGGYGNPGGTVNLVRKKPLDHTQYTLDAQAGSWSTYRVVADASAPLALDGKLRGRLVTTYQRNKYFYKASKDNKSLVYGILELDLTPSTIVSAGINYARQDSVPFSLGLPRYLNGEDLKLPRSTSLTFPWNRWNFETTEMFGAIEQRLASEWIAKFNLTRNRQASNRKLGYSQGAVNPTNGRGPQLNGIYNDYASDQLSIEATLSGAFTLFGQRQELTVGANRTVSDGGGQIAYAALVSATAANPYQPYPGGPIFCTSSSGCPADRIASRPPIDVFNFDPADPLYTEPRNPLPSIRYSKNGQVQSTGYVNLRLTAFDRLHLTTGLRWSRFESESAYENLCTATIGTCVGKAIGDVSSAVVQAAKQSHVSWPPPVSVSFDITRSLVAYLGYTDIYRSQAYSVDVDRNVLPPITGSNWEGGIKWAPRDGRLNLSLSAYRIRQTGFSMRDPDNPASVDLGSGITCCYIAIPNMTYESKGVDFDVTGELRRGWQVAINYTFNENAQAGSYFGANEDRPFVSISPKHLYKLWTSYAFGAAGHAGPLAGLTLSGGVNGQSSAFRSGTTCIRFIGDPNPLTGAQTCAPNTDPANPSQISYKFTVPSQALLSARIDYRFSDKWSLAVNLENILNKSYYQTVGSSVTSGHWYGAPRSVTATLRAKW